MIGGQRGLENGPLGLLLPEWQPDARSPAANTDQHSCREYDSPVSEGDPPEDDRPEDSRRSGRRRNRPRRTFDTSVPSPCIAVCQLDPKTDLCIGCSRNVDEIRNWPILTAEQKRAILAALPGRR